MESKPPSWLNEDFLVKVLQGENSSSQLKVVQFRARPAVAAGNNFTSHLFRVSVQYSSDQAAGNTTENIIVKAPHTEGYMSLLAQQEDFYSTEPTMYNDVLPKLCRKVNCQFSPKAFHCPVKNGMVLKDMTAEGYIMCNKFKQLDFPHCTRVIKTLAQFHAASIAYHHENPRLIETIGVERIYKNGGQFEKEFRPILEIGMKRCAEILSSTKDLQPTVDYLLGKVDHIWESLTKICKPKEGGFNVLNHGDCWTNNVLFKHNTCGDIEGLRLIDFQILRYNSPAIDLIFFLWTSGDEDVREHKQEQLYEIYLQTLNNSLQQLGCSERLARPQLQQDLRAATDFALTTFCFELPITMNENASDLENADEGSDEEIEKLFEGTHFRRVLPKLVKQFQNCFLK